jgi:hypothetical protein
MKNLIIIVLVLLGAYWLFDHTAPLPLNHESFGLYEHMIHRIIGIVLIVIAALVGWKWKSGNRNQIGSN